MAELVDALVSGTSIRMDVQVRVLFWAQKRLQLTQLQPFIFTKLYPYLFQDHWITDHFIFQVE